MMKTIGIIGASGKIGFLVCKWLEGSVRIRGGCRSFKDKFNELKDFEWVKTDIYDSKSLEEFSTGCDAILNCTGPAAVIKESIALTAQNLNIPYIDTSDIILVDKDARKKLTGENICVGGAGYVPGLGGLLLKWASNRLYDNISKAVCFQGGIQSFSAIAFTDIILGAVSGVGYSDSYYRGGRILKENNTKGTMTVFPGTDEAVFTKSYLSEEMIKAAEALGVKEVHWSNMVNDEKMMKLIMDSFQIIMTEERSSEIEKKSKLSSSYMAYMNRDLKKWSSLIIELRGKKDNKRKEYLLEFNVEDEETACSLVAAMICRRVLKRDFDKNVYWAFEIMDANDIDELLKLGKDYFRITEKEVKVRNA